MTATRRTRSPTPDSLAAIAGWPATSRRCRSASDCLRPPRKWARGALDDGALLGYNVLHMKDSTVTIRLPRELRRQLEKLSKAESRPVSDLVRESIQRYVSIQKFRALRRSVLPFAEAEGLLTDEDVFSRIT